MRIKIPCRNCGRFFWVDWSEYLDRVQAHDYTCGACSRPNEKGSTMLYALITILTLITTALPSSADIYKYRDASGKLVISNQPPPAGAEIESQRESTTPSMAEPAADPEPERLAAPRPAPQAPLSYVDLNPIELHSTVEGSEVYWKKFVTGRVKNRSGRTTATGVTVTTACTLAGRPVDGGTAYLGTLGPRDAAGFQIPIILHVREYYVPGKGWFTPKIGRVSCDTEVTYTKL